jgi:hypothetical protein
MSPYTALRLAYDGTGVLPFALVAAPGGLALGPRSIRTTAAPHMLMARSFPGAAVRRRVLTAA